MKIECKPRHATDGHLQEGLPSKESLSETNDASPTLTSNQTKLLENLCNSKVLKTTLFLALLTALLKRTTTDTTNKAPSLRSTTRVLSAANSNIFEKSQTTFLVEWGTVQSGCHTPPVRPELLLECKGGTLNVVSGEYDCSPDPYGGMKCAVPTTGTEWNGLLWKQGILVATCEADEGYFDYGLPVEFRVEFELELPTVCLGRPLEELEPGKFPMGNFETFLKTSQMCNSDGEDIALIREEDTTCSKGEAKSVERSNSPSTMICRSADECMVPVCALLGVGMMNCPAEILPCQVKPSLLVTSHNATQFCAEADLNDVEANQDLWDTAASQKLTLEELFEAGMGKGPGYHL